MMHIVEFVVRKILRRPSLLWKDHNSKARIRSDRPCMCSTPCHSVRFVNPCNATPEQGPRHPVASLTRP